MPISAHIFKGVQASLAGAVTIVTTRDEAGLPWGFTATSFCSLSLDPPLILTCLARSADCYSAFLDNPFFAVNVLSDRQRHLSQLFATKGNRKYRDTQFEEGRLGVPLLPDSLARLECRVQDIYPGGDHCILVGLVEHGEHALSDQGL
ncbi:MAG: flavin reductase family protein, partial [Chloroflexi bacterium]|nr:flavin reductase family protein [Chloroflexota bacterium]